MLTTEQVQKFKEQLLKQAESLPEEHKKLAKHKILSMSDQELEDFLKQNSEQSEDGEGPSCIFCAIIDKKSFAYVIADTAHDLAILEINPLSKGHILVLPKTHSDKEPDKETVKLAEEIAEKIKTELSPKKIDIFPSNLFGHSFIEIVPSYGEKLERKRASQEELSDLQAKLKYSEKQKDEKNPPKVETNLPKKEIIEPKKEEVAPIEAKTEKIVESKPSLQKIKPRIP